MVNQNTIGEILSSLQPNQKEIIQNLRALIKNAVPESVELIKNGKITYKIGDKDFVWISHFQDHVDLEFAMGASLESKLLRTRGAAEKTDNTRHISVINFDVTKPEVARLLKEATAVGFEHCPTK